MPTRSCGARLAFWASAESSCTSAAHSSKTGVDTKSYLRMSMGSASSARSSSPRSIWSSRFPGVAADQLVAHQRVHPVKGRDAVGQAAGGQKLSAADGDGALQLFATVQKVPFGFLRKGEKLLARRLRIMPSSVRTML